MTTVAIRTNTATLIDEENLRRFRATTGKGGLMALFAAVKSMLKMLLKPFRIVARVLYGSGNAVGTAEAAPVVGGTEQMPGAGADAVTLPNSAQTDEAFAAQVAAGDGGSVMVDLSGEQNELDEALPMIQRHMELLLKAHLPADVNEHQLRKRLTTLAEAIERGQFAYWIVSRQVGKELESLSKQPMYVGMTMVSIEEIVKVGAKTPVGQKLFAPGSAEESLMARMAFRDQIFATYNDQVKQIAKIVLRYDEKTSVKPADLFHLVQAAADSTREKLQARFPASSTQSEHMLEKIDVALNRALAWPAVATLKSELAAEVEALNNPRVIDEAIDSKQVEQGAVAAVDAMVPVVAVIEQVQAQAAPVAKKEATTPAAAAKGGMFGSLPRDPEAEKKEALRAAENVIGDDFDTFAMG